MENLGLDSMVCRTPEEISHAFRRLHEEGATEGVAKSPYGAAGQKNHKFPIDAAGETQVARIFARQGAMVIEPWLARVFDFSIHYDMTDAGLRRVAFVQLENDRRGQFSACVAARKFDLPAEISRFLLGGGVSQFTTTRFPKESSPSCARPDTVAPSASMPLSIARRTACSRFGRSWK